MRRYIQISNIIKGRIKSGEYITGEKIPYGHQLCAEFSCSKITLNNALDILVQEGFITRQRGLGTVVKTASPQHPSVNLPIQGVSRLHESQGMEVHSHLLHFDIDVPGGEIAGQLAMSEDQYAWHFKRVRYVGNDPLSIEETWIPVRILPAFTRQHALGSVYEFVEKSLRKIPCSSHTQFYSLPSDAEAREWLHLDVNEPVSVTRSVTYLNDGQPFEYCTSRYHYQRFNYNAIVQRN
ncbi:GntR family transcriptional regulator [Superficieibacter sp.]|uniref:GntR family transcriptional regulator n=1 Tax=Superficieibacter sp. TaxID=2303322 RepID=UPI0028AC2E1E|nr:GntR family transcriptional regulator [Superficieibacter sp.]